MGSRLSTLLSKDSPLEEKQISMDELSLIQLLTPHCPPQIHIDSCYDVSPGVLRVTLSSLHLSSLVLEYSKEEAKHRFEVTLKKAKVPLTSVDIIIAKPRRPWEGGLPSVE